MNNLIKEVKEDYENYTNKKINIKGYEILYNIIDVFESSTDYGLSANFNYDIDIKNGDLFIEYILIGKINEISSFERSDDEISLIFTNYIIEILLEKTYEQNNKNEVWISKIIKKNNDIILLNNMRNLEDDWLKSL